MLQRSGSGRIEVTLESVLVEHAVEVRGRQRGDRQRGDRLRGDRLRGDRPRGDRARHDLTRCGHCALGAPDDTPDQGTLEARPGDGPGLGLKGDIDTGSFAHENGEAKVFFVAYEFGLSQIYRTASSQEPRRRGRQESA